MATIKDVAKRAGVSTTTVSHVINKTRFVAEETKAAVWAAIKELHYSPSAVARSLKVNHTKSIGLLATSSEAPYFAEVIEAVENSCYSKGYTLILCNSHNNLTSSAPTWRCWRKSASTACWSCAPSTRISCWACWKITATSRWW